MHIEFKKLILHNFMSFGHSELSFGDDGFIRVSGVNQNPDDSATSNGSGKSSLWEGVIWALTGSTIRGTKQIVNMYGDDGTYVNLLFNIDGSSYDVLRSKDHKEYKTNIRIIIDGKDCSGKGIRESENLLAQYLPDVSASLLGSVIILGQGLPQKFTNNTPSGRKEVLEKLSKSDFMIEDLKDRVAKRKKDVSDAVRGIEDTLVSLKSREALLQQQIATAECTIEKMDRTVLEKKLFAAQSEVDKLRKYIDEYEKLLSDYTKNINELKDNISVIEKQKRADEDVVNSSYNTNYSPIYERQVSLQSELKYARKALSDAENIKDTCPTCGQKLVGVMKPDISPYKSKVDDLSFEIVEINKQLLTIQKQRDDALAVVAQKYDVELSTNSKNLKNEQLNLSTTTQKLNSAKVEMNAATNALNKCAEEIMQFEATLGSLRITVENNTKDIKAINESLTDSYGELEEKQMSLEVLTKFETILKRDFRGFLLSNIIEFISKRAKEYCKVIFDTDKIGFYLDGNNIEIDYLDKAYENLSGGERQKIDLIVQFSIRDMLCGYLGFTSNILVLDEVFDGLDMIGCQRVLDVISSISDIKNIFIVTHRRDLSVPTDKEITVVKSSDGISELRC